VVYFFLEDTAGRFFIMERVKYSKVEVKHGNSSKKFPVYEIYLDGMIVTKVSSEIEAVEMVSRWQEIYK
jgi:hypothetical protein